MPELPEVETVLQGLRKRALSRRVTAIEVRHPGVIVGSAREFEENIRGRCIVAVRRKGKALAIELAAENSQARRYLLVRLGMTGQLVVTPREAPLAPHTHVRLVLEEGSEELRFRDVRRFGRLRCCTGKQLEAVWNHLGPDAQQITEAQFLAALRGRRGAIKSWLMNQQVLAGLGNIYADEALFAARIHPLSLAGRLSTERARCLYQAVRKVLKQAVRLCGTSFRDFRDAEGRLGNFRERLRVYQHDGEPCACCGTSIRRRVIAGRSSHFCPHCQVTPRVVAKMRGPRL